MDKYIICYLIGFYLKDGYPTEDSRNGKLVSS